MNAIYSFIKKNQSILSHLFFTGILCVLIILSKDTINSFLFLVNFIISIADLFCIYRMLFKKKYSDSILKICCLAAIAICANNLYSYAQILNILPCLKTVNEYWFWTIFLLILFLLLIIVKIFGFLANSGKNNNYWHRSTTSDMESTDQSSTADDIKKANNYHTKHTPSSRSAVQSPEEPYNYLRLTGIIFLTIFLTGIPAVLLIVFNKYNLDTSPLEFDKVISFFISYGFAFLLILFAVIFVFITILHIIKYIFHLIASFNKANEKRNDNSDEPVPTYAFSVGIVLILMFLSWKISSFNIDDLTERLVVGDYLALPLASIVVIILFFILVNLVHAILIMLNGKSIDYIKSFNRKVKLSEKIFRIIKDIVSIILDTMISILDFIRFIPDFFSSLSELVIKEEAESLKTDTGSSKKIDKHHNDNEKSIKIVKVAAFAFALLSWIATAQGLHEYVFQDYYWQALLISFGIQSILFVFNLKLPYFFRKIGRKNQHRELRKYHLGRKKGLSKTSYKWSSFQRLTAIFYAVMIFSSSFFSFVYITNLVYRETQYVDAQTVLNRNYRRYLDEADEYCAELIKIMQLTISNKLSELQEIIPASNSDQKTQEELEVEQIDAESTYMDKVAEEETAQTEFDTAREIYMTPMSVRWRDSATYAEEKAAYDRANEKLEAAKKETTSAEATLNQIEQALVNYKPSADTVVHELLLESLKTEPNQETLSSQMTALNDLILQNDEEAINSVKFADIVSETQELSIAVDNYQTIKLIQSQDGTNNDISDLKAGLLNSNIAIPVPGAKEFEADKTAWGNYWKERFNVLEELIGSIPNVSDSTITNLQGAEEIVDTQMLLQFDTRKTADEISKISRSNLENINAIERAVRLLFQNDFPALAIFSMLFALFLDISSLLAGLFIYLVSESKKAES